ncbi:DUF1440 domain-containing protein [Pseudomonas syringae pv. syringae]|uniref:YagU family protein n=1 Tax=Pseudomonas TaxID=286 RepID=UPI0006B936B6|nr:DUF1440 domain-containing protein [Pseudomonas syringae]AVB24363.1 DUF1440 domain-containing protein [Pseudomonas syringae pv. syringae]KWS09430.1 hypothetical protein AL063_18760 [Pseudomonas syringae pv. syringae]MCF5180411.1 DUF1440 domain-containing protein [Pseudomonas syringae]MCF5314849.1 DUF1440 domain-containing protein [Pseudomonas syringae]MCF5362097.1 DUF1440 domain-containing protein [Pseudomonas syringae]
MNTRAYGVAALAGFVGGNVSSFIKWGTEIPFPPRTPDRPVPPVEMLDSLGINAQQLTYVYSEHVVNYGSALVHHGFSIFFAMFYCLLVLRYPRAALWQGLGFGLLVTLGFHGVILPAFHWAPPLWELPASELLSETFGHLLWMWVIEVIRRDLQQRWLPHSQSA